MALLIDPKDATERIIELVMKRNQIGFSADLSPATITKMAMLDVDALESDDHRAGFFSGLNWSSALEALADDMAKEASLTLFLRALLNGSHSAAIGCSSIEAILEEEFESSSSIMEEQWRSVPMLQKAQIIAKQRARKDLIFLSRPADYTDNKTQYEFKVVLQMLYNGNGRHHGATGLAFSYNTPFHRFLRTLEDRTQLCVIPPVKISQSLSRPKKIGDRDPYLTPEPPTPASTVTMDHAQETIESADEKLSSSNSSRTTPITKDDQSSSSVSSTTHNDPKTASGKIKPPKKFFSPKASTSEEISRPWSCKDRGYTLDHGPWSYRIVDQMNPPSCRIWKRLAAPDDYIEMMETIKILIATNPKKTIVAIIMHSLDVEVYEECDAQKLKEPFEDGKDDIPLGWDETLDDVDDDSEGEPYLQWFSRRLRSRQE